MGKLKKIFFSFLVLFFMQVSYGYLYPANGWPTSFTYHYGNAENEIQNMFKDEKVSIWFNRGYNPDDRYSPINKENKRRILEQLKKISDKAIFDAINQVKNCSTFNKLFGNNAEKYLPNIKNRFTFAESLPNFAWGTTSNFGIFVKTNYLKYFLYHVGK